MTKIQILNEIKRTAAMNGGEPLGTIRFESETGIKVSDWFGHHWTRWSDALQEAGFKANQWNEAYDENHLLRKHAELTRELGHIPVNGELQMKRRRDRDFPSKGTFSRFGSKENLIRRLAEFCDSIGGFADVRALCEEELQSFRCAAGDEETPNQIDTLGYVYLLQHGARREYKVGRTNNVLRREGEIAIELPEKVEPLHVIKTDDPAGIEAYWHKRFATKRKNGEWFELSAADVSAFKRRKFM